MCMLDGVCMYVHIWERNERNVKFWFVFDFAVNHIYSVIVYVVVCGDTEATRRLHKPYQVNLIYSQRSIDVHDSIIPFIDAFLAHFYIRVVCFVNRIFWLYSYQFGLFVWLEFLHTVVDYMWPCLEIKFQQHTKAAMFKLNFSIASYKSCLWRICKPICVLTKVP